MAKKKFRTKKSGLKRVEYLLEQGTLEDMRNAKAFTEKFLEYHWKYYSELAYQRKSIEDKISLVLSQGCIQDFSFSKWQRTVKWKYSLHPLCALGSLTDPGGRFNVGEVNSNIPTFPALYIASDKDTAFQETLIQNVENKLGLSSIELAMMNPQSEATISMSGQLERVFDLRKSSALAKFVRLTRNFKVSDQSKKMSKELGLFEPAVVQTVPQLFDDLMSAAWRDQPMQTDVPANAQLFGQMIHNADIDGVLYNSIYTGKECLAIFPRNFNNSTSYLTLDDAAPDARTPKRLDSTCWKIAEQSFAEVSAH